MHRWNSVSVQNSTSNIMPRLDAVHQEIRRLATNVDIKIQTMQDLMIGAHESTTIKTAERLQSCIHSAASVLSSASTVMLGDVEVGGSISGDFTASEYAAVLDWVHNNSSDSASSPAEPRWSTSADAMRMGNRGLSSPTSSIAPPVDDNVAVMASPAIVNSPSRHSTPASNLRSEPGSIQLLPPAPISAAYAPNATVTNQVATLPTVIPELQLPQPEPARDKDDQTGQQGLRDAQNTLDVADSPTTVTPYRSRSRSRSHLSRLFGFLARDKRLGIPSDFSYTVNLLRQYRRKLCFVGDGACGKTCLLV